MNLFNFLNNFTILATAFLMREFSARAFVIAGSSLTVIGLLMSSFVQSVEQLLITFSITTGVGLGLLNPACFVALLSCFTTKRNHAVAITFAALGLGQNVMPYFVSWLIAKFSYKYAIVIISGCAINGIIGGSFLIPIKWNPPCPEDEEQRPLLVRQTSYGKETFYKIAQATDLDLLRYLKFISIVVGLSIVTASQHNLTQILPVYLSVRNR